jgi:hypothetical protein
MSEDFKINGTQYNYLGSSEFTVYDTLQSIKGKQKQFALKCDNNNSITMKVLANNSFINHTHSMKIYQRSSSITHILHSGDYIIRLTDLTYREKIGVKMTSTDSKQSQLLLDNHPPLAVTQETTYKIDLYSKYINSINKIFDFDVFNVTPGIVVKFHNNNTNNNNSMDTDFDNFNISLYNTVDDYIFMNSANSNLLDLSI